MTDYHRLPVAAKLAASRQRLREPTIACPRCDTQTTPGDMPGHLERCPGPREPHPGATWLTFGQVLALGVSRSTLSGWTRSGHVRVRGEIQDRRYLMRDVAVRIAARSARR